MKKKMVYVAAALIIGAVTVFNVKTVLDANRNYDLAMTSIDALSEDGEGEGGNGGESGDQESNNHGSGKFFYEHKLGSPKSCKLYRHVSAYGTVEYSTDKSGFEIGWTSTPVDGVKELCPDNGSGCTVYTCQKTN